MSKATSALTSICGIIIFFIGLSFVFGMIAENMIMIVAGPFLIVAIILMAIGVYLMSKGHKKWQEAKRNNSNSNKAIVDYRAGYRGNDVSENGIWYRKG